MYFEIKTIIIFFCILIAIIDLKSFRIPDILLVAFTAFVIILEGSQAFTLFVFRFAVASGAFLLFGGVWYFTRGIGFGDVKYAALLGYVLGPGKIVSTFLITALLGIIVYAIGILLFSWPKTKKIPYAPFLSAGAIFSLIFNIDLIGGIP